VTTPTPWPPGSIDQPAEPRLFLGYLDALGQWLGERRHELDRLDQAILKLPDAGAATADLVVALSVWQTIQKRYEECLKVWDSGRVTPVELKKLAALVWSRLDDAAAGGAAGTPVQGPVAAGLSVHLGEACRLSDALTAQLAATLRLTPVNTQVSLRLAGLRAQAERLRDQVKLEPPERQAALRAEVDDIAADTAELAEKADRGGDIGGSLGPMEIRAAKLERDLIVGNAQRRQQLAQLAAVRRQRAALEEREQALAALVAEVQQAVTPAPKYAVPHVAALGPMPAPGPDLARYTDRLTQVGLALDQVEQANRQALKALADLKDYLQLLDSKRAEAAAGPHADALAAQAAELLAQEPAPLEVVKPILAAYRALLTSASGKERP
jgi:hypothetical protein